MKIPKKTTADVPRSVAAEYKKAPRGQAVAEATGDGYTDTRKMKKAKLAPKGQFGLPPSDKDPGMRSVSGSNSLPLSTSPGGVRLRIHVIPDDGV